MKTEVTFKDDTKEFLDTDSIVYADMVTSKSITLTDVPKNLKPEVKKILEKGYK